MEHRKPGGYHRSKLRYPTDLTDKAWALIGPLIPPPKLGGNKRKLREHDLVDGLTYILGTRCQWAAPPADLPVRSTVTDHCRRWTADGTLDEIHFALYRKCLDLAGREASPTAAIIDAHSVKSGELSREERTKDGETSDRHTYDASKKIKGKNREPLGDTKGLLPHVGGHRRRHAGPRRRHAGQEPDLLPVPVPAEAVCGRWLPAPAVPQRAEAGRDRINIEIVNRSDAPKFVVLPKRRIVERTIACLNQCRRLAKDREWLTRNGLAFLRWVSVRLMVRRLCKDEK